MSSAVDDPPPILRKLDYLGGHPSAPTPLEDVDVSFNSDGVTFHRAGEELGGISWKRIRDLSADAELTTGRVTVPRIWLFNVFAVLFKKRQSAVLLRLADDRGAWLFSVDGITLDELRRGLEAVRRRFVS